MEWKMILNGRRNRIATEVDMSYQRVRLYYEEWE